MKKMKFTAAALSMLLVWEVVELVRRLVQLLVQVLVVLLVPWLVACSITAIVVLVHW